MKIALVRRIRIFYLCVYEMVDKRQKRKATPLCGQLAGCGSSNSFCKLPSKGRGLPLPMLNISFTSKKIQELLIMSTLFIVVHALFIVVGVISISDYMYPKMITIYYSSCHSLLPHGLGMSRCG